MPIIQIELLEGRSIEQKKEIVSQITKTLVEVAKCQANDVRIIIRDMKTDNYAVGGKLKCHS